MFCRYCATPLLDEASFCWKCGKPQKDDVAAPVESWEYCEILAEYAGVTMWLNEPRHVFYAKAIGPKGTYTAARSTKKHYLSSDNRESVQAQAELVNKLLSDGWEAIAEKGPDWYSYKFRRRVKN